MNLPTPPWYKPLNEKLKTYEWLVDALLVVVIVVSILALVKGDRIAKTGLLVYLISP